jgi:hypothetical protein
MVQCIGPIFYVGVPVPIDLYETETTLQEEKEEMYMRH